VLSVAICDHYNHVRQCLENRPFTSATTPNRTSSVGRPALENLFNAMHRKTYRCTFVKATPQSFLKRLRGRDFEDLVRDLVKAADSDVVLAQYGIVYIDEIDKIASAPGNAVAAMSRAGVQINLLKSWKRRGQSAEPERYCRQIQA